MENVGIKADVATKSLEQVEVISIEVENVQIAGQDILKLRLTKQIESLERKQESLDKVINNLNEREGVDLALQDLERKKELTMEQLNYKKAYLEKHEPEMKRRFENFAKRIALDLIKENKIKNHKQGAGTKRKIDGDIELAIAKAIKEKSVVHGRRHDLVLYCNRRVKACDLLGVANYYLKEKGKSEIKSHVTVFNRARPKRLGTGQDKRHIGLGLFCTKKPPKTDNSHNELTHHQRKHRKLARQHIFRNEAEAKYGIAVSKDDKAYMYIRPGTSGGFSY